MGNNLSSIAPLQILPHDHYISQLSVAKWPTLSYKRSLNASRFLKSVLCQFGARDCVVKLFVLSDQSDELLPYRVAIEEIAQKLEYAPNCMPYFTVESTDHAVFLVRQYEKASLYDRMSMRPFFSIIEKKWITFQILNALKQCHEQDTCHGDIKMENLLVTPWLWIYLTDFASCKPILLPEDDPANYTYFFDPSWRRLGYVAPERFIKSVHVAEFEKKVKNAVLTPAMDMFSVGCVITELFTETPLFKLPSLFRYMAGEYYPDEILKEIEDDGIKEMVIKMISIDPMDRKDANHFLQTGKGTVFPKTFYDFLWPLMAQNRQNEQGSFMANNLLSGMMDAISNIPTSSSEQSVEDDVYTIFATIIASNLDDIKDGETRMTAIQILGHLARLVPINILNDTIVPAMIYLTRHAEEVSTALSLTTLTKCISQIKKVPTESGNLFPDGIYPCIGEVVRNEKFFVRRGVAETIGFFAQYSHRFLIFRWVTEVTRNYFQEKKILEEAVNKIVASIFCDSVTSVRKAIANHSIQALCMFFGVHKASDALMSHLITYLNEKKDFLLRMSFYPSIVTVAHNVEYQPAEFMEPLLLQGLSDVEERVAVVSIHAMEQLVTMGEFDRRHLASIISHVALLLIHPNIWIKASVIRLISVICENEPMITMLAVFKPLVVRYLTKDITLLNDEEVIWGAVRPNISRNIFEEFLKSPNVSSLFVGLSNIYLKSSFCTDKICRRNEDYIENDQRNRIRRLLAHGLTEEMLQLILDFKDHFIKVNTNQNNYDASLNILAGKQTPEKIEYPSTSVSLSTEFLRSIFLKILKNPLCTHLINSDDDKTAESLHDNLASSTAGIKQLDSYISSKLSKFPFEHHSYKRKSSRLLKVDKDWRPEGKIVAHLHEHKESVTRLAQIPGRTLFVSSSRDGTAKIWDCSKTERKYPLNKSKATFGADDAGQLISLACDINGEHIAVADHKGSIDVFKLDHQKQTANMKLKETDFMATDMHFMDFGSSNVLTFGTPYSNICGWDIRSNEISFRLENHHRIGPITSYVISPCQTYLVHGTSFGFIVCWDLRYRMPVSQIMHPEGWDIKKVKLHPTNPAMIVAAMGQNNEIDFYGLEFKTKSKVLWASPSSPVKSNAATKHSPTEEEQIKNNVNGLHVDQTKTGEIFVISGGDDCKLRYWNLDKAINSKYICNSYSGGKILYDIPFSSKEINGTEYIIESFSHKIPLVTSEQLNNVPIQPYPGHKDTITDLLMTYEPKTMIISSSRDGVIKLWK